MRVRNTKACNDLGQFSSLFNFLTTLFAELRHAYGYATGGLEERRTAIWSFTVLVSAGVEKLAATKAYEQIIENGYLSTMEVDPHRRLQQIRSLISMLEAFDSMANANNGDEVRRQSAISFCFLEDILTNVVTAITVVQCLCLWSNISYNRGLQIETPESSN